MRSLAAFLGDPAARAAALAGCDAQDVFLALWSIAFDDAPDAIPAASKLLCHKKVEHRFAAVHLLGMLDLREIYDHVLPAVNDADLRVAVHAVTVACAEVRARHAAPAESSSSAFDLISLITQGRAIGKTSSDSGPDEAGDFFRTAGSVSKRIPDRAPKQKPLIWPWMTIDVDQKFVADQMVVALGSRPASRVLPYLDSMSPNARAIAASFLAKMTEIDAESRSTLVRLVGDAAVRMRETAVKAMMRIKLKADELAPIEALLDRKKSDLRRSVLTLILSLDDCACARKCGSSDGSEGLRRRGSPDSICSGRCTRAVARSRKYDQGRRLTDRPTRS